MFVLVDGDAHGIEIACTYKFGSRTMMHENDLLVAPRLEWIGVKQCDLAERVEMAEDIHKVRS